MKIQLIVGNNVVTLNGDSYKLLIDGNLVIDCLNKPVEPLKVDKFTNPCNEINLFHFDIYYDDFTSSFIKSFEWTNVGNMLVINKHNGGSIKYKGVAKELVTHWISRIKLGDSVGEFYNERIKGVYHTV